MNERSKIIKLLSNPELSNKEIAFELGYCLRKVVQLRKQYGIPSQTKKKRYSCEAKADEIKRLVEQGHTLPVVAKMVELPYSTVYAHCERRGLILNKAVKGRPRLRPQERGGGLTYAPNVNYLKAITAEKYHWAKLWGWTFDQITAWIATPEGERWWIRHSGHVDEQDFVEVRRTA